MYGLLNLFYLHPSQSHLYYCHCERGTTEAIQLICHPEFSSGSIFKIDAESSSE